MSGIYDWYKWISEHSEDKRDLGIDDKKWAEIEKQNPAPLYFESGRFGGMIIKLGEIEKE